MRFAIRPFSYGPCTESVGEGPLQGWSAPHPPVNILKDPAAWLRIRGNAFLGRQLHERLFLHEPSVSKRVDRLPGCAVSSIDRVFEPFGQIPAESAP
jgi:hypothetical protein